MSAARGVVCALALALAGCPRRERAPEPAAQTQGQNLHVEGNGMTTTVHIQTDDAGTNVQIGAARVQLPAQNTAAENAAQAQ